MNADDLVSAIQTIQQKILSIPLDDSSESVAQSYLNELKGLLEQITLLDDVTRQRIRPTIEKFSGELSERVKELESQLSNMHQEAEKNHLRQQTIKAYSGTGKIF